MGVSSSPSFPDSSGNNFLIRPASEEDLAWISGLQQRMYSIVDAVPIEKLKEWFQTNPGGFFIIENDLHHPAGQITFLPLKPDCLERYRREGDEGLIETEIIGRDLYPLAEKESISDLYLESIILPDDGRRAAMKSLLKALPEMISGQRRTRDGGLVFALAATPAGERWLAKMGFFKISRASARRDGHDMYQAALVDFLARAADLKTD